MEVANVEEAGGTFERSVIRNIGEECRICLKKSTHLWKLFQNGEEAPRKIMAFAAVQVEEGDGLPSTICSICRKLVDMSYKFKCQVEKSDATLREILALKALEDRKEANLSLSESVNAAITEAIADELPHAEIERTAKGSVGISSGVNMEASASSNVWSIEQLTVQNLTNNQDSVIFSMNNGCSGRDVQNQSIDTSTYPSDNIREMKHTDFREVTQTESINVYSGNLNARTENIEISGYESNHSAREVKESEFKEVEDTAVTHVFTETLNQLESKERDELIKQEELSLPEENEFSEIEDNSIEHLHTFDEHNVKIEVRNDLCSGIDDEAKHRRVTVKSRTSVQREREEDNNSDEEERPLISRTQRQKCQHCIKTFATKLALQRHMTVHKHKTKLRYVCYMCDKQFSNVSKLKGHIRNSHDNVKSADEGSTEEIQGKLPEVPKASAGLEKDNTAQLEIAKSDRRNLKFTCKVCSKQFAYQKTFLTHAKTHPEYKEELLNGNTDRSAGLNESLETLNRFPSIRENDSENDDVLPDGLQCKQCGKLFATKRNLNRHVSMHSGLKFNCSTCGKEFSRADKLKEHEQSKHKEEMFSPSEEEDDDDMDNENRANDGIDDRKKEKNRPHQCALCPKAFAQPQSLANHVERHKRVKDTQKRFLCEVCSKCFAQSSSLVAHMRTHTGVKPYVCNICSRAFTKSTYLQLHLRTHSGEKPYICQYCSRAFARANTLARHITMHTGEAKYHCQICMKSFRRLTSLNEHTYTHTGQRPYACKICTKRYNNAGSLYAHTKKCKAQQVSGTTTGYTMVPVDNGTTEQNSPVPQMLIYSQRKLVEDSPVGQVPPTPQFMIANVHSQKPISGNIIQPFTVDDPNVYATSAKQFKGPYYSLYPNMQ
ncbi:zinc finger protein 287-like [Orussus abietinus]|uniref:zinc finger protein 287-like n=1 Tax=Orussus abietinus TaxID=222816 RepID=UPI0006253B47|nr:zinc finger protein 287-like [Orussus abietinus]